MKAKKTKKNKINSKNIVVDKIENVDIKTNMSLKNIKNNNMDIKTTENNLVNKEDDSSKKDEQANQTLNDDTNIKESKVEDVKTVKYNPNTDKDKNMSDNDGTSIDDDETLDPKLQKIVNISILVITIVSLWFMILGGILMWVGFIVLVLLIMSKDSVVKLILNIMGKIKNDADK